jgi:NAD-dependent SIR2 family protein deacetylase
MANPHWFQKDPFLAWGFYGHRLNLYRETTPHQGFEILLKWGEQKSGSYFVFTSNVDGQFQKAGFDDDKVNECHGSIHHLQCSLPCSSSIWPAQEIQVEVDETIMKAKDLLPLCNSCGKIARPNILMFGDWNWISDRSGYQQSRFQDWLTANKTKSITIVECGAGTGVPTVRMTSESIVSNFDASLVRINVREPNVPAGQIGIALGALEALQEIDRLL